MACRRTVQGVLGNFLGTYTSRYSDYDGYWLFGFLVADLGELRIDLLGPTASEPACPLGVAVRSASARFEDQFRNAGLARSQIRDAWLLIRRLPGTVEGSVNGHPCDGYWVSFLAGAVMDGGRRFERHKVMFVAPHHVGFEMRSTRATKPDKPDETMDGRISK